MTRVQVDRTAAEELLEILPEKGWNMTKLGEAKTDGAQHAAVAPSWLDRLIRPDLLP